jgi:hypothetical protein
MPGRAACLLLFAATLVAGACAPPLRVVHERDGVTLDVRTLGEYLTSISRLRLSDAAGTVVWEMQAQGTVPQVFTVSLVRGANPSTLVGAEYGAYTVVVPAGSPTFSLEPGRTYTIQVWGANGRSARASFAL